MIKICCRIEGVVHVLMEMQGLRSGLRHILGSHISLLRLPWHNNYQLDVRRSEWVCDKGDITLLALFRFYHQERLRQAPLSFHSSRNCSSMHASFRQIIKIRSCPTPPTRPFFTNVVQVSVFVPHVEIVPNLPPAAKS
jgi:hypothetical protein